MFCVAFGYLYFIYGVWREIVILKDYYSIYDEIEVVVFCQLKEIHFQHFDGARNVTIDFKCNVFCWYELLLYPLHGRERKKMY